MRRVLVACCVLFGLFAPTAVVVQAAPGCQFELGFAALEKLIPTPVGACLEDENHNPVNGDGLQHTQGGLMVWRKADNWTAFTDGYHTWINGPNGLQERLNDELFPWEKAEQVQSATSTLIDRSGNGELVTDIINPKGNYDIAYTYDCTRDGLTSSLFSIVAQLPNNASGGEYGEAPTAAMKGQGVFHFTQAGPHVLHVFSYDSCTWHITVTG